MLTDLFKVYHAHGIVDFKPDVVTGIETFVMDGERYEFTKVYVVEHNEHGNLVTREVNTLCRVDDEDDEWMRMTGYSETQMANTVHEGNWAAMNVYGALDLNKAVYMYMLRWEDGNMTVSYLVKDPLDLADLVNRLKVLGEVLR